MVYVNRFTDQLPHCWGPEEGEEGKGGGRVEKNGGGKIGGRGNEENSARAAPKGGRQGVGDTSLQCVSL